MTVFECRCTLVHMKKKRPFVYTNVGFRPEQHRLLKHLAIEERKDLADLVRDAVDVLIEKKRARGAAAKTDFVLHELARGCVAKEERAYKSQEWGRIDQDLYGEDPHK